MASEQGAVAVDLTDQDALLTPALEVLARRTSAAGDALVGPLSAAGGLAVQVEPQPTRVARGVGLLDGFSAGSLVMSLVGDRAALGWWVLDGGFGALCAERRLGAPLSLALGRATGHGGALSRLEQRTLAPLMRDWLVSIEGVWRGAVRVWAPAESASASDWRDGGGGAPGISGRRWCVCGWSVGTSSDVSGTLTLAMDEGALRRATGGAQTR